MDVSSSGTGRDPGPFFQTSFRRKKQARTHGKTLDRGKAMPTNLTVTMGGQTLASQGHERTLMRVCDDDVPLSASWQQPLHATAKHRG